jgi:hypothetical protein
MQSAALIVCVLICLGVGGGSVQARPVEKLLSAETGADGINVTMRTGGCTSKSDFAVNARPTGGNRADVEFNRLHPDDCKGNFPGGLKLFYSWSELKLPAGTAIVFKNLPSSTKVRKGKLDNAGKGRKRLASKPGARSSAAKSRMTSRAKKRRGAQHSRHAYAEMHRHGVASHRYHVRMSKARSWYHCN